MHKPYIYVLSIGFLISTGLTAQSLFNFSAKKPAATQPVQQSTRQVLSPEAFKAATNKLSEQTQNRLTNEYKQAVAKSPPLPSQDITPTPDALPPVIPTGPEAKPIPPSVERPPTMAPPTPVPVAPPAPPPMAVQPVTPQEPIYSGFQNQNAPQQPNAAPQQPQESWKITY